MQTILVIACDSSELQQVPDTCCNYGRLPTLTVRSPSPSPSAASTDRRTLGWGLAALGMLLVSTDSLFVRLAQEADATAWDVAFLISAFSVPVHLVLNRLLEDVRPLQAVRADPAPLIGIAVLLAASQVAFITAITRTSIANVVVIVAAAPIFAAVFAWFMLGERTSLRVWLAIAITIVGILVVASGSLGEPTLGGDALALFAIVTFGANTVVWRQHPEISRFVALAMAALLVVIITAPFAKPFGLSTTAYLAAAGMGFLFNPAGRIAHSTAPKFAPAAEVALFSPVETVAATLWAWLAFREEPKLATIVGGTIVLVGLVAGTVGLPRSLGKRAVS